MISKELLSEVYHSEVLEIFDEHIKRNLLFFTFKDKNRVQEKVNIYELAHKCKDWALSKGYIVIEYPLCVHIYKENTVVKKVEDKLSQCFIVDRVFKACEWIMEHIK